MVSGLFSIIHAIPDKGVFLDLFYNVVAESSQYKVLRNTAIETNSGVNLNKDFDSKSLNSAIRSVLYSGELFKRNGIKYSIARTFFFTESESTYCSKLVIDILEETTNFKYQANKNLIPPYKLYEYLSNSTDWSDVTRIYECYMANESIPYMQFLSDKYNNLPALVDYYSEKISLFKSKGIFTKAFNEKLEGLGREGFSQLIFDTNKHYINALNETLKEVNIIIDLMNGIDVNHQDIQVGWPNNVDGQSYKSLCSLWNRRLSLGVGKGAIHSKVPDFILTNTCDKPFLQVKTDGTISSLAKKIHEDYE